jgi:hypothetical protein
VLYYVSAGAQALGLSLNTVMEMNVSKLTDRGDYANYLRQKMEAEAPQPQHPESKAAAIVEMHKDAIRAIYDQYPGLEMEQDDT